MSKLQSLRGMVSEFKLPKELLGGILESANKTRREFLGNLSQELISRVSEKIDSRELVKEILDKKKRSCTLRPEGTASVVRAAIEHGLLSQGAQRLWYGGPMFRYERPQAGRQRQFHQIGVEWLGVADATSDAEVIALAWDLLADLGVGALALEINSLGSPADRAGYRDQLVTWLEAHRAQLDADSQARIHTNPLRVLDSKHPDTQALLAGAPTLADALSPGSRARFDQVQEALSALDIPVVLNPRLVRGLDYYSHTAFEITSSQLGAQATVCGGGRYDGLVEQLGGPSTPAIGWALGMERLVLLLEQRLASGARALAAAVPDLYVVSRGEAAERAALALAVGLRRLGLAVERDASGSAFGKQFKRAERSGAPWVAVIGDDEVASAQLRLRSLLTPHAEDQVLPLGALDNLVRMLQ
ncbi:MAG: histidine--tRNA ligase [Synechococcaceae bacterium WB9_2_112]|nr:histidine--tRNA ligase [Synechococcaceae bacterium WB9_2_112]